MSHPILDLDQEWHRQRAQLRANHVRPPPLVTAGLDLSYEQGHPARVQVSGLALIFGIFPATLNEFIELAQSRLRLGNDAQRAELTGILNTRIQALWAWMPTLQQDCYLELDHATGDAHIWLVGPGSGQGREVDIVAERQALDEAFLAALVITSSKHWGGQEGLAKLVERFGRLPLLVAAQVAEALERHSKDPQPALAFAQSRWPALKKSDEAAWEPLANDEHPWVCVQLGRLALRLGLPRAARLLLNQAGNTEVSQVAWFDLGQACEALDDLVGAETAFTLFATAHGDDPDGWRRLLFCRLRLGLQSEAEEALKRFRSAGNDEGVLVEWLMDLLKHGALSPGQRAQLVGWFGARLAQALRKRLPVRLIVARLGYADDQSVDIQHGLAVADRFDSALDHLRHSLHALLPPRAADDSSTSSGPADPRKVETLVRVALLCLPFADAADRLPADELAMHTVRAYRRWAEIELSEPVAFETHDLHLALVELATQAAKP